MHQTYVVNIDFERLRDRVSAAERKALTPLEIQNWLVQKGFYPRPDGSYVAEEEVLQCLAPSELLSTEPVIIGSTSSH